MKFLLSLACGLASLSLVRAEGPPPSSPAAVPLFDGRTLEGWEGNAQLWRVQDGCLTGGSLTEKVQHNDFLATAREYGDFIVRFQIKLTGAEGFINSGFQIRSQRVPKSSEMSGYQCDFGEPNWYGAIYDESRRNKVLSASDMAALRPVIKKDDWNEYVIRARGPRITTWINGVQGTDYTEAEAAIPRQGRLGIQVHGGGKALVQVKDVTIEELPPPAVGEIFEGAPAPKKAVKASPLTPEEERASFSLPPGFEIELIAAEGEGVGKFVPLAFDQKGALWTTTAFEYPVDGNENSAAADALYASKAKDKVLVYDRDPASPTGYATKPRVFAEGLAIPLGVLPFQNGCYVQHGHDIVFLSDTDGDGKADKREVILTGFGVQDSHLFPHQFLRAPGRWIWMAQGAFNYGKVRRPNEPAEKAVKFDQTRMARFRPDGSEFTITSNGPCNIWGLVLDGLGQAWIQEANDFGYPVMPFHEYGNYPGCSDSQWKSYAPEFPGTAKDFRMGGTGLSGLAVSDRSGAWPGAYADVMYVANPITNRIQAIKITPEEPRLKYIVNPNLNRTQAVKLAPESPGFKYEKLPDFLTTSDEWFRPVAITFGPDGCLYIVDWYNKIISHNEVPRNHPERDKVRGRIWRVKATAQKPFEVPDFTTLNEDALLEKLGGPSLAQSQLAWQAISDRKLVSLAPKLWDIVARQPGQEPARLSLPPGSVAPGSQDRHGLAASPQRRLAAFWAWEGLRQADLSALEALWLDPDHHVRREGVRAAGPLARSIGWPEGGNWNPAYTLRKVAQDVDPAVRAEVARVFGAALTASRGGDRQRTLDRHIGFDALLQLAREPLSAPVAPSTRNGKPILVGAAYDRAFERYLVRMFLEPEAEAVAAFLDSPDAADLPVEARLLCSLALEPKASAARVAKLLPQLQRPVGEEELLRLAQFPGEPGVGEALQATLENPATRASALEALLKVRTRLDAAKIAPLLTAAAKKLIEGSGSEGITLGVRLAEAYQLAGVEEALVRVLEGGMTEVRIYPQGGKSVHITADELKSEALAALRALRGLHSDQIKTFERLSVRGFTAEIRAEAVAALAASRSPEAGARLLALWPKMEAPNRRAALAQLSATKAGAKAVVEGLKSWVIAREELDGSVVEKLQALLGQDDPDLAALLEELAALFRPVLVLDGSEEAWSETGLTLDGPFTVETWVRLDPKIDNNDGILGSPGQLDVNFFDGKFRVWIPGLNDVAIAKTPITADLWTHVALTRDAAGKVRLYQDGEPVAESTKLASQKFEKVRIGWTQPAKGTAGALSEFRIWMVARSGEEIRHDFDRSLGGQPRPEGLALATSGLEGWGKLRAGAKLTRTSDFPPVLSPAEAQALDGKFTKYRAQAEAPGDAARGKIVAAVCQACHLFKGQGASIGPDLSGVGAMGNEAILRNILTPNAAMENGYRIYRVELKSGELLDAFFVSEDAGALVVRLPGAPDRRIPRTELRSAKYLRRSLMPEGLLDALTPEQVSDLFAYLRSMK